MVFFPPIWSSDCSKRTNPKCRKCKKLAERLNQLRRTTKANNTLLQQLPYDEISRGPQISSLLYFYWNLKRYAGPLWCSLLWKMRNLQAAPLYSKFTTDCFWANLLSMTGSNLRLVFLHLKSFGRSRCCKQWLQMVQICFGDEFCTQNVCHQIFEARFCSASNSAYQTSQLLSELVATTLSFHLIETNCNFQYFAFENWILLSHKYLLLRRSWQIYYKQWTGTTSSQSLPVLTPQDIP